MIMQQVCIKMLNINMHMGTWDILRSMYNYTDFSVDSTKP